jgi:TetR/AcrR family transcriptional repressor of nem operon
MGYLEVMARTKDFDPTQALDKAMRLFWRKGYEGTSTQELLEELGIARASLYGTFGSKRQLYVMALGRFIDGAVAPDPELLLNSHESALESLRELLDAYVSLPDAGSPKGCFAINATVEHGDTDVSISAQLERNRARLESALRGVLFRARIQGELRADVDPDEAATMLLALISGLKVLARAGADQDQRMRAAINATLALLVTRERIPA